MVTHQIKFQITTKAPVLLTRIAGNTYILNTDKYIPGSASRGMLANYFLKTHNLSREKAHEDPEFYRWFLGGDIIFTNSYITDSDNGNQLVCYPTPVSMEKEKYGDDSEFFDVLLFNTDESDTTKVGDYCYIENGLLYHTNVKTSLNFHHARDRKSNTPKEGDFFNYEAILPEQTFTGMIIGSKENLEKFYNRLGKQFTAYLGRSRNSQYGRVEFTFLNNGAELFRVELDNVPNEETELSTGETSLTLLSDTIIYDQYGNPSTDLYLLEKYLNAKILKAFVKTSSVENFISVWKLRRPSEVCFSAGSCFLIKVSEANKTHLLKLQKEGIGERLNEGFGRFVLGWQRESNYDKYELSNHYVLKPRQQIAPLTRDLLYHTIKTHLFQVVELQAITDARKFLDESKSNKGLPSKSLIGRLELLIQRYPTQIAFSNFLKNDLRGPAKDQLQRCRSRELGDTLFGHIQTYQMNRKTIEKILMERDYSQLLELGKRDEISFNFDNPDLHNDLYHIYMRTLFSAMRRLQKVNKTEKARSS
ncbi:RAMP superfamily CRISPR-associated protein [Calditrichota bacterium LG25]